MAVIDQIEQSLADHDEAITTIEGFMEKHATEAAKAVDPLRLEAVLAKIKQHSARLSLLMNKFPLLSPETTFIK